MRKFWIIALDIYKKNVKSGAFVVMILFPFIIMGIAYIAGSFAGGIGETSNFGVVASDSSLTQGFEALNNEDYDFKEIDSEANAQKELADEKIDGYLLLSLDGNTIQATLYSDTTLGTTAEMVIQQYLTSLQSTLRATGLGLTTTDVASLNEAVNITSERVSFDDDGQMIVDENNTFIQSMISFASTILLMVFIMTYAQIVAQEIASEKGTRIMEVILSSTTAKSHFYGKIVGVLLVALTQMVVYALVFGIGFQYFKNLEIVQQVLDGISVEQIFGPFLIFTIIYIFLGILIYSVLSALCGSLVSKSEDTAKAIMPVTYLSLGGYILGIAMGMSDPNNIVIRVTSYIPFLSSYIMPVRLASNVATNTEAMISVAILAVTTVALMLLSANLYKSNVLVYNEGGLLAALKQSFSILRNERRKVKS
ncbi:ABC transporter permease [Enterococcus sp. LJL120]